MGSTSRAGARAPGGRRAAIATFFMLFAAGLHLACAEDSHPSTDPVEASPDAATPDAAPLPDAAVGTPLHCPALSRPDPTGVGCQAIPEADCPGGSFPLPGGRCSAPWVCPEGWVRSAEGIGCVPPPLREDCTPGAFALPDGTCSDPWPCPDVWSRAGGIGCEAPEGDCPELVLADGRCASFGFEACAEPPAPAGLTFVDAAAAAGGDGSAARPFRTIAAGLASGRDLYLAPGTYPEALVLDGPAQITGGCASATRLSGGLRLEGAADVALSGVTVESPAEPVVVAGRLDLRNVDVRGAVRIAGALAARDTRFAEAAGPGLHVEPAGGLDCLRCAVERALGVGVLVSGAGASAALDTTVVRDTRPADRGARAGVRVEVGASLRLTDAWLLDNRDAGLYVARGATAEAMRLVVRGTRPGADRGTSGGVALAAGQLTLTDAELSDNGDRGLDVTDAGEATLARVFVRRAAESLGASGAARGVAVRNGSKLTMTHSSVEEVEHYGLLVEGAGSVARLHTAWVRGVHATRNQNAGRGIGVVGGEAELVAVEVADVVGYGVTLIQGAATGSNLAVRDTQMEPATRSAGGLWLEQGQLDMSDVALFRNNLVSLFASNVQLSRLRVSGIADDAHALDRNATLDCRGAGSQMILAEVAVTDVAATALLGREGCQLEAEGVTLTSLETTRRGRMPAILFDGVPGRLERVVVSDVRGPGILASGALARVDARRVVVGRLESTSPVAPARGIEASAGGRLVASEVRVDQVDHGGLFVLGESSAAEVSDLTVHGARSWNSAMAGDVRQSSAAVVVSEGAQLRLTRTALEDNESYGLLVLDGGRVDAEEVHVAGTAPGDPTDGQGDGIYLDRGAVLDGASIVADSNVRAGVVVSASDVSLRGSRVTRNLRGLLRQLETRVVLESTSISGNRENDVDCDPACFERPVAPRATPPIPEDEAPPP